MGYETELVIGTVYSFSSKADGILLMGDIARIDLSKAGCDTATGKLLSKAQKEADTFYGFYGDDGDTIIKEDRYGEKLTAVPIDDLIAAMEQDNQEKPYRRFTMALGLLKTLRADAGSWKGYDVQVVQFGH